ncbi:unnamed protein product [Danaus chrysippus]|uniref:(African queen) hypothetical protein n=1 Tax=Danaus chrysippus TaxID=151541 RepID=A0A8J2QRP3_9NEOP|nr:unnamed protein product [Danaus chrysippus]
MDDDHIRLLLEELSSSSSYEDENDSEVEDNVEVQEETYDTEQDDDNDEISEEEHNERSHDFYLGKDGQTRWNKSPASNPTRRRARNIVTQLPGARGEARNLKEPGLLLFAGVRRNARLNAKDFFRTDGSSPEIFRLTMGLSRFFLLMRCLRFDSKDTREERIQLDKLAPIRELFDIVVGTFKKYYSVSQYVTIDEKLEAFRGRCNFRQYIPSKPNKYGIKIYALTDAKMFYTHTMEVYVGKQPDGPYQVDNSALALVLRLSENIHNTGRNITCDNFFTSIPLIDKLESQHKLTVIGTIRKNKRELAKNFTEIRGRAEKSSLFGHRGNCSLLD